MNKDEENVQKFDEICIIKKNYISFESMILFWIVELKFQVTGVQNWKIRTWNQVIINGWII